MPFQVLLLRGVTRSTLFPSEPPLFVSEAAPFFTFPQARVLPGFPWRADLDIDTAHKSKTTNAQYRCLRGGNGRPVFEVLEPAHEGESIGIDGEAGWNHDITAAHYADQVQFCYPRPQLGFPEVEVRATHDGKDPDFPGRCPAAASFDPAHDRDQILAVADIGGRHIQGRGRGGLGRGSSGQVGDQSLQLFQPDRMVRSIEPLFQLFQGKAILCELLDQHLDRVFAPLTQRGSGREGCVIQLRRRIQWRKKAT